MPHLPDEIMYMIFSELLNREDLGTLFNCACSSKQLATMALTKLYRTQAIDTFPADPDSPQKHWSQERIVTGCAGLWRTIILSSLGKTLYPYSTYIRSLDLDNLEDLLACPEFRAGCSRDFFQNELAQFQRTDFFQDELVRLYKGHSSLDKYRQWTTVECINRIGETITKQTPLLQELTGRVFSGVLSQWIPRLPRLTTLETWPGAAIKENGTLIRLHCPSFKGLYLQDFQSQVCSSNKGLPAFLNELRPQSLESFSTSGYLDHEPNIFQALRCHRKSLRELELDHFDWHSDNEYAPETNKLVESLSIGKFVNITDLRLQELDGDLIDQHIAHLAGSLPKLEALFIGGCQLTDAIWGGVATLGSLRKLEFAALTTFTANGILGYIEKLGPGNKGLVLSIVEEFDIRNCLSESDQDLIRETIFKKVQGRFEYSIDPSLLPATNRR